MKNKYEEQILTVKKKLLHTNVKITITASKIIFFRTSFGSVLDDVLETFIKVSKHCEVTSNNFEPSPSSNTYPLWDFLFQSIK